jgi:hypothetical protein
MPVEESPSLYLRMPCHSSKISSKISLPRELTDTEIHDIITAREILEMSWRLIILKL